MLIFDVYPHLHYRLLVWGWLDLKKKFLMLTKAAFI